MCKGRAVDSSPGVYGLCNTTLLLRIWNADRTLSGIYDEIEHSGPKKKGGWGKSWASFLKSR